MLKDKISSAIVAVSDLTRARRFYKDTLGLPLDDAGEEEVLTFRTGDTRLVVYPSQDVRPGSGNAVVWGAGGDVEAIADELRSRGVTFEEYPEMGMRIDRGVHKADGFAGIWFKDPDSNILHVNSL